MNEIGLGDELEHIFIYFDDVCVQRVANVLRKGDVFFRCHGDDDTSLL